MKSYSRIRKKGNWIADAWVIVVFVFLVIVFYSIITISGKGRDVVIKEASLGTESESQLLTILRMPIEMEGKNMPLSEALVVYGTENSDIRPQVEKSYGAFFSSAYDSPCCAAITFNQGSPILFSNPGSVIGECYYNMDNMESFKALVPSYSSPIEVEFRITKPTGIEWCSVK
ncbi:hypothetical protein HY638_00220 [Candidatus Woesearchaeota archaeon]|nr:hypothetical protein [Candidatus Woesearchaeota archaeon]